MYPERLALEVEGRRLSYGELGDQARSIAATLMAYAPASGSPLGCVFASRSVTAFAGVLGTLLSGRGYVALNHRFPVERSRLMLKHSDARTLVVDASSAEQLPAVLPESGPEMLVLLPDRADVADLRAQLPNHTILGSLDMLPSSEWTRTVSDPRSIAYIIFTSGSTGVPKGVMVQHRNLRPYIANVVERWNVAPEDRLSQTFDMTFDLSVSDMFVAWEAGACVCCPSAQQVVMPKTFINSARLTVWYAVPSAGLVMKRLGMLTPGTYPDLRLVLFCGEALPIELANSWADAAPNASLENVYGPTEVTITCASYAWDPTRSPEECEMGVVPIGAFHPETTPVVLDEGGEEVSPGDVGELFLAGPQVTAGYWADPERTAAAFYVPPGRDRIHYKTGDRVRRPLPGGPMTYLGRVDFQVKVSGHRVELGEIEAVLRQESGADEVVALGWPPTESGYAGVTAFVAAASVDSDAIRERMLARLPDYMVPRTIRALPALPLNVNGKVDRRQLISILDDSS